MKTPFRVLLFFVATTLILGAWLAYLRSIPRASKPRGEFVDSGRLANGVEVRTSFLLDEQKETLSFFDASAARITLDHIPADKRLWLYIVVRRRGKPDERSVALIMDKPPAHLEYTTCVMPLGAQVYNSDKLKAVFETNGSPGNPLIFDNPFKGLDGRIASPTISEDKTGIELMAGTSKNYLEVPLRDPDAEIRFVVATQDIPAVAAQAPPAAR